jgi:hypothetical protein
MQRIMLSWAFVVVKHAADAPGRHDVRIFRLLVPAFAGTSGKAKYY